MQSRRTGSGRCRCTVRAGRRAQRGAAHCRRQAASRAAHSPPETPPTRATQTPHQRTQRQARPTNRHGRPRAQNRAISSVPQSPNHYAANRQCIRTNDEINYVGPTPPPNKTTPIPPLVPMPGSKPYQRPRLLVRGESIGEELLEELHRGVGPARSLGHGRVWLPARDRGHSRQRWGAWLGRVSPHRWIPAPVPEVRAHAGDHAGRQRSVPLNARVHPGVVLEEPRVRVPRLMLYPAVPVG